MLLLTHEISFVTLLKFKYINEYVWEDAIDFIKYYIDDIMHFKDKS